jgi:hypothetical protein
MNPTLRSAAPGPAPYVAMLPAADRPITLFRVLAAVPGGLTRQQILKRWPADRPSPGEVSVWRWLMRGARDGTVLRTGTGRRGRPFVYRLAGTETPAPALTEARA